MNDSSDESLIAAYLETRWTGALPAGGEFDVGIGEAAEGERILASLGSATAAILTAWNPRSRVLAAEENRRRNDRLREEIAKLGLHSIHCVGAAGEWREESILVPDLPLGRATGLGRDFEQNAIVWWDRAMAPALVVTRSGFAGLREGEIVDVAR